MKFPYVEFVGIAEERIFRPMIPVTFKYKKYKVESYALIDSGADYTILPLEAAGDLKFSLSDQPQYYLQGAGGESFKIYKSPEPIEQIITKTGFKPLKSKSFIYFGESCTTFLLGQSGFLNHFSVRLNGRKKEIEIS
ncbi:hypothetical protein COV82_00030 [Candidatus Peregrinibacteria bacterium CG11_big_fil_rev_8_21_14_0_20_46_8]|nr:MAG: hypothetical protein COV82_00030 [Candidatus Peregrinibacteria bacterium CG11_big_fil_rev_8_21_14_0_20_46_8]